MKAPDVSANSCPSSHSGSFRKNCCIRRFGLLLCLAVLMTGCSQTPQSDSAPDPSVSVTIAQTEMRTETAADSAAPETTAPAPTAAPETTEPPYVPVLPLLSIQTTGTDSLDFVTEPVAAHVSEQWASWTPGYRIPSAPYYADCSVGLTDAGGTTLLRPADARVKVRGNWTTLYDKKPLHIKFSEKQNLLGLNGGAEMKNWVLLAEYKDASMLRNKTAFTISRGILAPDGLYAADSALAEVEINGEYWGVYLVTEQQQVNKHRIAVTDPEPDSTDTHIGYLLEFDGYYYTEDALHQFRCDYADNAPLRPFEGDADSGRMVSPLNTGGYDQTIDTGISIKSDICTQEQHDFIESYVNNVYKILYAAAYQGEAWQFNADYTAIEKAGIPAEEAVRKAVDVQSLADMYIIQEIMCDADVYWSSFCMDVDFGEGGSGKLTFEAPWDFDSALGNKDRCADGQGFYAASMVPDVNDQYDTINPWLAVLMHEEWFRDIIRETWTRAYDSGLFDRACEDILNDANAYASAFERNYDRWDNLRKNAASDELSPRAASCRTQMQAAEYLEEWLRSRVAFLNAYWHS